MSGAVAFRNLSMLTDGQLIELDRLLSIIELPSRTEDEVEYPH